MKQEQILKRLFKIAISVGLIWLVAGCYAGPENGPELTPVEPLQPTAQLGTPTVIPTETARSTQRSSPTPSPGRDIMIATEAKTVTPFVQVTTAIDMTSSRFLPQIALMVGEAGSYPSIGVFDTRANELQIIGQPTETRYFGRPLWSPEKDLLAYAAGTDDTPAIEILDPAGTNTRLLKATAPQAHDGSGSSPGMFLFGWSYDADWLAYDYIYEEEIPRDLHLVNRTTSENIPVEGTGRVFWFEWSPNSINFAISDSESIYIGSPASPDDMEIFQGEFELGVISWHPKNNELLVARTDNRASDGFNELWSLHLDAREWVRIGSYPEINEFTYSPNGQLIAIYSSAHWLEINLLTVVDAHTFEIIAEIKLPEDILFSKLNWLNDEVMLTSKNNIYIIPINSVDQAYWYFEPGEAALETLSQATFTDW